MIDILVLSPPFHVFLKCLVWQEMVVSFQNPGEGVSRKSENCSRISQAWRHFEEISHYFGEVIDYRYESFEVILRLSKLSYFLLVFAINSESTL